MDCERTVNCPYNVSHQVSEERLQYHLVKCKRNHPWKDSIHILQITQKAKILESELDCEWNKVGGLIPLNPATLPPLDEDWNGEYVQSPLQNIDASDKPVFRNLPGATKSERKMFRREERCRFEKVIETMKKSEKSASSICSVGRRKQNKNNPVPRAEEYPKLVETKETPQGSSWKNVKGRSRRRRCRKNFQEKDHVINCFRNEEMNSSIPSPHDHKPTDETSQVDELLVAFHDISISTVDNVDKSPNSSGDNNNESDVQSTIPNQAECVQNSVFQEWDKILIHDLPTTVSSFGNIGSPPTFFNVSLRGPKDNAGQYERIHCDTPPIPTESSTFKEGRSSEAGSTRRASITQNYNCNVVASSPTSTGELSNSIKAVRSRSAHEAIPTTRDKAPFTSRRLAESKTNENYTNLNYFLGRTSRNLNKTDPPNEKSDISGDLKGVEPKSIKHLGSTIKYQQFHPTSPPETAVNSLFETRQETTPFSYAGILSKNTCSHV